MGRVPRRQMLAETVAVAGAALLAACGSSTPAGQTATPDPTSQSSRSASGATIASPGISAATALGKRGGTLRIGQAFDIQPARVHSIIYPHYAVISAVFDTLIRLDATNMPQPELAESWQFSPDFTDLTLSSTFPIWHEMKGRGMLDTTRARGGTDAYPAARDDTPAAPLRTTLL